MKTARRAVKNVPKPIVRRKREAHAIVKRELPTVAQAIEEVLIRGDLTPLTAQQRVEYYKAVCKSLGLNPLTGPFGYILFKETEAAPAKLVLYAKKDCAEQLRKLHKVAVVPGTTKREVTEDFATTELALMDNTGRTDTATGIVYLWKKYDNKSYRLTGQKLGDAIMKSETKAKRRGTLSICGLGILDEMDLDSVQVVGGVTADGRIYEFAGQPTEAPKLNENAAHGHAEGSERAKQADASLARCEEEDRKLKESVPGAAWKKDTERKADMPPIDAKPSQASPELAVAQVGDMFEVSGQIDTMNEFRGLLLHYGKRKGQVVAMDAEGLNQFTYQFVDLRKGKLTKKREPGVEG